MKAANYKAAIYRGIGKVEVGEMPYPQCGDDDVIVKNLAGGICGSDTLAYSEGWRRSLCLEGSRIWPRDGE